MKKTLLITLFGGLLMTFSSRALAQSTVEDGQSTEGKDFWVTFMQADQRTSKNGDWDGNYNTLKLSLSVSSRKKCQVTISNPFTDYSETVEVAANTMQQVDVFVGSPLTYDAREAMESTGKVCYAVNPEMADTCALHVTATENISLFATNYKKATFDATNVLPTASLLDEYVIQSYSPSDHGGTAQGTHFAIVAVEDGTVASYVLSESTTNHSKGDTVKTDVLKAGQVWYVWTGNGDGDPYDLSGTQITSNKKIAVFQGCPHTNIPTKIKERDHLFSQAMPTKYWGNTFVLTASKDRKIDYIRIMALNDGTEVKINGELVHTFDFSTESKHYWEFTIGENGKYAKTGSCVVTTSCPCATHLFIASKGQDGVDDGDPAMLWVNPIEQQIDQITFATYSSDNGTTSHYVNVVTDKPEYMFLDGSSISENFKAVSGSSTYKYAQISLGSAAASHTLKSMKSNFIAHVYGFTSNESYGYSAGGATKPLTQYITINGEIFTPDTENTLCGEDVIRFACHPDYEWNKIEWYFGDGDSKIVTEEKDSVVEHYYEESKTYKAYVLIYRESSNLCSGQNAVDSIPITVTIGRYEFTIGTPEIPCPEAGKDYSARIPYTNEGKVNLHGDNVTIEFDQTAKADGFDESMLEVENGYFAIAIPESAQPEKAYGIRLVIESDCGGADTTLHFMLNFDNNVIDQRGDDVLGLLAKPFEGKTLSDYQWYRLSDSTAIEGQVTSNLNFQNLPYGGDINEAYYVCFTINKGTEKELRACACAKAFKKTGEGQPVGNDFKDGITVTAFYSALAGRSVFVNADYHGELELECYAQWINVSGQVYNDLKFEIPDEGCTIPVPADPGLYLLRVTTGKETRSFKFVINQ